MKAETCYGQFDLDERAYPELTKVYDYWQHKQDGRIAPAWTDISLLDLSPEVIPRVCVVNVGGDKLDFTYRFWGTAITGLHHYDLTGKSVQQLKPADYAKTIYQQYKAVYETRTPQGFLTKIPLETGLFAYYAAVRMPLSSDGNSINMIMCAEHHGREREQLRGAFEKVIRDDM